MQDSVSPGLLIVDKPIGITSRTAVDFISRPLRPLKVGHAGTLDPLASGVLVLCVGAATRLIDYVHRLPKRYLATFRFGVTSPTLDLETEPVELPDTPRPTRAAVEAALAQFRGPIDQRPPAHSAVWVAGRRSYELARRGDEVELAPRSVTIHDLRLLRYEYPDADLDITCSTGTYIRSLGNDIAASLGTAAVMTSLTRESIGPFERAQAIRAERMSREAILAHLRPAAEAVPGLPRYLATDAERELIAHGRLLEFNPPSDVAELAAVDPSGSLLAILQRGERGWRPRPNLIGVQ